MLKFKVLCAIVALTAALVAVAEELSETGELMDGISAIVDEGVVLKTKLRDQLELIRYNAAKQGMQLPPPSEL